MSEVVSASVLRRTPLFEEHVRAGGKMVPFAGWEMPVQYTNLIDEHKTVREAAGLFDVSHMGEISVRGPEAMAMLQALTCNDVGVLVDGRAQYSAITNERGGVIDDIIIYRIAADDFFICVNASNAEKDFAWFKSQNRWNCEVTDVSAAYGQIAIQGPQAIALVTGFPGMENIRDLTPFSFVKTSLLGIPVMVARTGYTGEDGVEVFIPWADTPHIWRSLLHTGGARPIGLGARDTLRLEAAYPLHGHELSEDDSAYESGLGWIIKLKKGPFSGSQELERVKAAGIPNRLIGFVLEDAGIARHGDTVVDEASNVIGTVTSGTKTPTVGRAIGLARVPHALAEVGSSITLSVRGRTLKATVVKTPFYSRLVRAKVNA